MPLKFLKSRADGAKPPAEIGKINDLEKEIGSFSDDDFKKESASLRERARGGEDLKELLPRAFALVREAAKRTLGQRHYDVQLWSGLVIHNGGIAEMKMGEGKTLASTAPIYLNALSGKGVHVITVNEYLAKRDAVWMGEIYDFLGLKVACLVHDGALAYDSDWKVSEEEKAKVDAERDLTGAFNIQEDFLRPISRKEAYEAEIVYGTNHEFGFDYLRDNLRADVSEQVQSKLNFVIVDEVDSILIDEARTPLIISSPDTGSGGHYKVFAKAVGQLTVGDDYLVDEKLKSVEILEQGINKVEKITGIKDLYAVENLRLVSYLDASLKAKAIFQIDKEYVVKNGEVVIVDQFTGRMMPGRRYSAGLHQAIEAKEGLNVKDESRTVAQITIQNYFRLYSKLAGMTGTAQTSAEEFDKVYGMKVVSIPTNRPLIRDDASDVVYKTLDAKYNAVANEVKARNEKGQPVLLGTISIDKNELLSSYLQKAGVPHEVLNAKNNEREGSIIAQAGREGAVTVATNMAGRGIDIILGGNPSIKENSEKVKDLGGLHVIGTARHDARRIDNQLRGRAGRQGDPGSSRFFLSLEDDLMRVFGGERIQGFMEKFDLPEDMPIENKMISKAVEQAQGKVEGFNFDSRKHLLDYDDILNKQRGAFYKRRQEFVEAVSRARTGEDKKIKIKNPEKIREVLNESIHNALFRLSETNAVEDKRQEFFARAGIPEDIKDEEGIKEFAEKRISNFNETILLAVGHQLLDVWNMLWMNHLEDIEALSESVRLRAYGQRDPLVEYRKDGRTFFDRMQAYFDEWVFTNIFNVRELTEEEVEERRRHIAVVHNPKFKGVGRNAPCPCGAKRPDGRPKKFKQCHG